MLLDKSIPLLIFLFSSQDLSIFLQEIHISRGCVKKRRHLGTFFSALVSVTFFTKRKRHPSVICIPQKSFIAFKH